MLDLEQVKYGAALNRRTAKRNPMVTLKELKEADPTADHGRLFRQWREVAEPDADQCDAVWWYYFANHMAAFERIRVKPALQPSKLAAEERQEAIRERMEKAAAIILLDLTMPNGKKARYCKGTEVVKFGGGWVKAGRKAGARMMGDVFSEQQLRKLMV